MAQKSNEWHLRDPDAVLSMLDTDKFNGLTPKQVQKRRYRDGKNKVWHVRHSSATEYAMKSLGDLTSVLLVIAALTAAVFEKSTIAASVCTVLVLGILFRVVTYVRVRRVLERMADEGIPNATVIRGGVSSVIRADAIVEGDIIVLSAGDTVPCDGRIVQGDEIRVSEQGITENKTSVIKGDTIIMQDPSVAEIPCEYRVNMLFAGSNVLSGQCKMVATACGDDTLVSMRRGGLIVSAGEDNPIADKLSEWCRKGSVLTLICVFALSGLSILLHALRGAHFSLAEAFIDAMALVAASVSSYLVTVGAVTLAIPIRRLSVKKKGKTIVKDLSRLEKIADVRYIISSDVSQFKSGRAAYTAYFTDGEFRDVKKGDKRAASLLAGIMKTFGGSVTTQGISGGTGESLDELHILVAKMADSAKNEHKLDVSDYEDRSVLTVDYKAEKLGDGETRNVILRRGADFEIHMSGDIRSVLMCCDHIKKNGKEVKMTDDDRRAILRAAFGIEERGGNVIALAHRKSIYTSLKRLSVLRSNMCFDGFAAAEEGLGAGVAGLGEEFTSSAMSLVLLSSSAELDRGYLAKAGLIDKKAPILSCRDVLEGCELPRGSFIVAVPPRGELGGKIDAAAKVRMATVRKITDALGQAVVLTSVPSEAGMMSDETVGSAISASNLRPIPQTLKRRAEISVYPGEEPGYGGFAETVEAVSASISSLENLRTAALYTVTSQLMRLACVLLSIIFDVTVINAVGILLLGMIFDLGAVLVISFSRERARVTDGRAEKRRIPVLSEIVKHAAIGCLAGCVSFGAVCVSQRLAGVNVGAAGVGTVSAFTLSLLLAQLVVLSEFILDGRSFYRGGQANYAYFIYAAFTLAAVLLFMFAGKFCHYFGDVCPSWTLSTVASAAAVAVFALWEAVKVIAREKGS